MGQEQGKLNGEKSVVTCSKSCRPCGEACDKNYNTVKVDTAALLARSKDKENAGPKCNALTKEEHERRQRENEERERRQEEAKHAEEKRRAMEQAREEQQQEEQRRREEEYQRQQVEQEQREREELQRLQEEQRLEEEHRRQEEERAAEYLRRREEERRQLDLENKKTAAIWLKDNGFKSIDELVRKRMSKVRPLHVAVQKNAAQVVRMLLDAGADRRLPNSSKQIPLELAQKLDKKGSHAEVIAALLEQPTALLPQSSTVLSPRP